MNALDQAHLASERDVSRYTTHSGVRVPSVTEVLALTGCIDLGGVPIDRLEAGAARGRAVHHFTALDDRREVGDGQWAVPQELRGYMQAWRKFRLDTGFTPSEIEWPSVSRRHSFAGTLDRFGTDSSCRKILLDLKTAASPAPWWALQLAGYQILLEEWSAARGEALGPIERWSVRLQADGGYAIHPYRSASDRSDFLAALRVAHFLIRTRRYVLP